MSTTDPADTRTDGGTAVLRRALRRGVLRALAVALVVGAVLGVVAGVLDGPRGVAGAAIGLAVAVGFVAVTAVVGLATAGRDPLVVGAAVLGSWLVKAVVTLVVLVLVSRSAAVATAWVGIGILAGVVVTLWTQVQSLMTARVPYVEPVAVDGARRGRHPQTR